MTARPQAPGSGRGRAWKRIFKLCCGISYPHLRSMTGLQRAAVAVIGQEISHLHRWEQTRTHTSHFNTEAVLDASVEQLYDVLFLKVEEMHQWNPSIQQIRVLQRVGPETMITHEVSAETAGNLIGQRDFLSVRHSCKHQSRVYLGGTAIKLEAFPPQSGFGGGWTTCIIIEPAEECPGRSKFTWLLNMDVKGWLPKSLVNQAIPRAQLDFTRHLRRHISSAGGALRG
ncbi:hypothetical protein WMY93_017243 [Mugilogobius chulae]|uniref:START domain-containing protein 1 n=1 Tax=Mugilogobius chulae TaxID=88201 RepID=A0AAW0NN35_9GOBI